MVASGGELSLTKNDRDRAFWLAAELKQVGHTPHIHGWELKSGGTTSGTNGSATQNFDDVVIGAGSGELY